MNNHNQRGLISSDLTKQGRGPVFSSPLSLLARELAIRGFSKRTIRGYLTHNLKFLQFIGRSPRQVNADDIKNYLLYLRARGYSNTSLNNVISALKFYYGQILKRKLFFNIKRPKRESYLPVVLSRTEIMKLLEATTNLKHKYLLALSYGAGLRVSEVVDLKVRDLDFEQGLITIRQAKGNKDRLTLLPDSLRVELQNFVAQKAANDQV